MLSVTTPGFDRCLIPILSVNATPHHPKSLATAACQGIAPFPTLEEQEEPPPQSGGNISASSNKDESGPGPSCEWQIAFEENTRSGCVRAVYVWVG